MNDVAAPPHGASSDHSTRLGESLGSESIVRLPKPISTAMSSRLVSPSTFEVLATTVSRSDSARSAAPTAEPQISATTIAVASQGSRRPSMMFTPTATRRTGQKRHISSQNPHPITSRFCNRRTTPATISSRANTGGLGRLRSATAVSPGDEQHRPTE